MRLMKIQEAALQHATTDNILNMDLWIKRYFGTQDSLDKKLGLSLKTTNRWMNSSPRKFLGLLPELTEMTGQNSQDIIQMIMQRQRDVEEITG